MKIVPGDALDIQQMKTTIGPGVYKNPKTQNIIPAAAGYLNVKINKKNTNQLAYIESKSKRYIPKANDFVVGIVTGTIGESYKVSLQDFSANVLLSMMAFPNATKKNRPNLKVGQVVYARVSQDIPEIDIEIECIDPATGKEGGFGMLDESGYIFEVGLNYANELLFNPSSVYLEKLASKCKFEVAIGLNGKIWIKCGDGLVYEEDQLTEAGANDFRYTLAAATYLKKCQKVPKSQVDAVLKESFKNL
ncbi:hypothetical protein CANTEDRAFT_114211 [Yamadazyma tenuis ATCC 10573]|uniref:Ribosomal RNA-processing protein 40 n=2 Tax=Candida tenuis TaxID=2315449 RepID=G3B3H4_CANTC|nr:uncharacterized protein CANTEDRAFT_114211 [Yamadazyma tenuis ATCC 10573]EGV64163.1 hypothetical protein CANTEDRAFT_114211 [Yamadazyma tenuis ATCC 10573]